jgi:hypothetical protein
MSQAVKLKQIVNHNHAIFNPKTKKCELTKKLIIVLKSGSIHGDAKRSISVRTYNKLIFHKNEYHTTD